MSRNKALKSGAKRISKSDFSQKVNIQSGDEFEELADSFNRMLRHLVDTQAELRSVNKDHDRKIDELARCGTNLPFDTAA